MPASRKTDLDVWTQHLAGDDPASKAARIVVLNKIDGLWDELRPEREIQAEIETQVKLERRDARNRAAQVFAVFRTKSALSQK
jgi:hypothetical protein